MSPFELHEPRSLDEALALLACAEPGVRPAGGNTALMLMMKAGVLQPTGLVSLRCIEPHHAAIDAAGGEVRIGATATLTAIEHAALVRAELPVLPRVLRRLANVRVRNVATLGGNLAHADPHMDLPPLLSALGAVAVIRGPSGTRELAVEDLVTGYYETALHAGELIVAVRIPTRLADRTVYRKVTSRSADDWPTLGVAVALDIDGTRLREGRIVLSAAFDRLTRASGAEARLRGAAIDAATLASAAEAAAAEVQPIADAHASAAYKRVLVQVHVERALREACGLPVGDMRP